MASATPSDAATAAVGSSSSAVVGAELEVSPEWQLRMDDDRWLRDHPELSTMLTDFMHAALRHRPDDCEKFAINYFVHGRKDGVDPPPTAAAAVETNSSTTEKTAQ